MYRLGLAPSYSENGSYPIPSGQFRDDVAHHSGMISPGVVGAAGRLRSAPLARPRRDRMPAERTIMRQVREVLRLKFVGGVPIREIARRVGVAASTVRATIRRFQAAGLSWPLPEDVTDAVLEAKLF